jgi:hypothetical protein
MNERQHKRSFNVIEWLQNDCYGKSQVTRQGGL